MAMSWLSHQTGPFGLVLGKIKLIIPAAVSENGDVQLASSIWHLASSMRGYFPMEQCLHALMFTFIMFPPNAIVTIVKIITCWAVKLKKAKPDFGFQVRSLSDSRKTTASLHFTSILSPGRDLCIGLVLCVGTRSFEIFLFFYLKGKKKKDFLSLSPP
jgi:hypothetical protein